jgi:hypothetical protein
MARKTANFSILTILKPTVLLRIHMSEHTRNQSCAALIHRTTMHVTETLPFLLVLSFLVAIRAQMKCVQQQPRLQQGASF